jgi:lysyl-tRNA synthetase class 2
MDLELLWERARIIRRVRNFFERRGYLEVDTPLLAPDLIPESCLEVFETLRLPPKGSAAKAKPYWLIPSPEIWMKRLIARHRTNLYQICKCFRNGESTGRQHSPEFTMLEYYTMNGDYRDSLKLTEELAHFLLSDEQNSPEQPAALKLPALSPPFETITIEEAFARWAGIDLFEAATGEGRLEKEARRLGLEPPEGLNVAGLYDLIFIHAVEPELPKGKPLVLMDYPAFVPCLAKKSSDAKTVERWELYMRGIELANCYTEETNPEEVRRFFECEARSKEKSALITHRVDWNYWKLFQPGIFRCETSRAGKTKASGFPPCSGVALGLDRLIMVLQGRSTIDGVLPFPLE